MSKKCAGTIGTKQNPCCVYDFTLYDTLEVNVIRSNIEDICKKYCFQLEKGEKSGKLHYQGRISLTQKKRLNELIKILNKKGWANFHLSITSKENRDNNFYVCKEETRVSGPYTNENNIYIPKDVSKMQVLRPWQKSLRDELSTYNERSVDVIYEKNGNIGKSSICRYMMIYDDAELLPFCNDYKDVMRMAYDVGPKKIYLIDMPRAISKEKLFQFYSAIETLKSGYCYDDRYKFTRRLFDRPRICVFTNTPPDTTMLSKDMWNIWTVSNNNLEKYDDLIKSLDPHYINVDDIVFISDYENDNDICDFDLIDIKNIDTPPVVRKTISRKPTKKEP
ncbi:replication-associated protein [Crucivirus-111]|nr:replication-associated protein [Crucivirus-111]